MGGVWWNVAKSGCREERDEGKWYDSALIKNLMKRNAFMTWAKSLESWVSATLMKRCKMGWDGQLCISLQVEDSEHRFDRVVVEEGIGLIRLFLSFYFGVVTWILNVIWKKRICYDLNIKPHR